jgi:diguanylate cyclase (GGDEF)-like protein/PAS domain S-box-containing protein
MFLNSAKNVVLASEPIAPSIEMLVEDFPGMAYRCMHDRSWTMQYVSPGAIKLTGYAPEELIGNRKLDYAALIHPEDRAMVEASVSNAVQSGHPFQMMYRIVTASGETKWVMEHGNAVRDELNTVLVLQGFIADVSALRHAEDSAAYAGQRFANIAKATNDGIWDWDLVADTIWWNEGFHTLFGYVPDDIQPSSASWTDRIHPEDRPWVIESIETVIAGDTEQWKAEYRFQRNDGSFAYVLDRGFVIRDASGRAMRMVGGMSDLTERKEAELRLARLNRSLRLLNSCNECLTRAKSEQELLADICRIIVETAGYGCAWVGFARDDQAKSIHHAASFGVQLDFLQELNLTWAPEQQAGQGPTGTAVRTGEAIYIPDIQIHPSLALWRETLVSRGYQGGAWMPLNHGGRTIGVLAIYLGPNTPIDDDELQLLRTFASNLAFGIVNMRVQDERQKIQQATVAVAAGVSASTGTAFYTQLAHHMQQATGAQGAFVAQFLPGEPVTARTVVAAINGTAVANFDYPISGSPCASLLQTKECVAFNDVPLQFPESEAARMGMRTYVGCRLDSSEGKPLGALFVLYEAANAPPPSVMEMIRIFAARAASELERRITDAQIREQASLLDNAKDAIIVTDRDRRVRYWNKGAERLYGWTLADIQGRLVDNFLYQSANDARDATAEVLRHGQWQGEVACSRKDGARLTVETNSTLVQHADDPAGSILSISTDITQRKAVEREIQYLAYHDRLTALPNRHFLISRLEDVLHRTNRKSMYGALLCIDLDNFKTLNDTRGHDVGDLLLKQVSQRIREAIRSAGVVARFGGDEFIVLIEQLFDDREQSVTKVSAIAEDILYALGQPYMIGDHIHHGAASIGAALFTPGQETAGDAIKYADLAMYEAKRAGRSTVCFFDVAMQAKATARAILETDLRQAISAGEFFLEYQPQVHAGGRIIGAEALVRWLHPQRGLVSPANFITVAEETGLIVPIGKWVLETACGELRRWAGDIETANLSMSVNVSVQQFRHPYFVDDVVAALDRSGANPRQLCLELTESLLVQDMDATIAKMLCLKEKGVTFSLDDFGTGYSSLSYLKRLPLDSLKIDRSFVRDIETDVNDAAISRTVIALGQSLGLHVIAEGVETNAQQEFLQHHGCDAFQGYLFSRPLSMEALKRFVTGNNVSAQVNH